MKRQKQAPPLAMREHPYVADLENTGYDDVPLCWCRLPEGNQVHPKHSKPLPATPAGDRSAAILGEHSIQEDM